MKKLASYAINENNSLGRVYPFSSGLDMNSEESIYSKDGRRVLYSDSFNRLRDKTQVFPVTNEKTKSLSRMAHSLQVAKLAEDGAKLLNLNPDISYTLGLLHDIGHAPFGHLGQDVLNELMKNHGGFEHNFQALRIVDKLERNCPSHEGLNLTFEVREGLLKHCSLENAYILEKENEIINKSLNISLPNIAKRHINKENSFLESQLVDLCDSICYLHTDLQDAFKNRILNINQMLQINSFNKAHEVYLKMENVNFVMPTKLEHDKAIKNNDNAKISHINNYICNIVNIMKDLAFYNMIKQSKSLILDSNVKTIEDVKSYKGHLIGFTDEQYNNNKELKTFSRLNIYKHPSIHNARFEQAEVLVGLFNACVKDPSLMIGHGLRDGVSLHRNIADNISGMTDKFATHMYKDLKNKNPDLIKGDFSLPKDFEISPDKKTEKKRLGIG